MSTRWELSENWHFLFAWDRYSTWIRNTIQQGYANWNRLLLGHGSKSYHILSSMWNVITHPRPSVNGGLSKIRAYIITCHTKKALAITSQLKNSKWLWGGEWSEWIILQISGLALNELFWHGLHCWQTTQQHEFSVFFSNAVYLRSGHGINYVPFSVNDVSTHPYHNVITV